MGQTIAFEGQDFRAVGTSVDVAELDGERLLRVVKPEDTMEPDVPT